MEMTLRRRDTLVSRLPQSFREAPEEQVATGLGWFSVGLGLAELVAPRAVAKCTGVPYRPELIQMLGAREIASGVGILAQPRPAGWLWSRVAGDVMDLGLLLAARESNLARPQRIAAATAAVVGVTLLDLWCSVQLSRR